MLSSVATDSGRQIPTILEVLQPYKSDGFKRRRIASNKKEKDKKNQTSHVVCYSRIQEIHPNGFLSALWSVDANHTRAKLTLHARKVRVDIWERISFVRTIRALQRIAKSCKKKTIAKH